MSLSVSQVVADLPLVGAAQKFVLRAPVSREGGGITIVGFDIHNGAAITTAGFTVNLVKYTGGTAVAGTVASLGGTATSGDLGRPQGQGKLFSPGTIPAVWIGAGDAVALETVAVNSGTVTQPAQVILRYVMGRAQN